MKLTNDLKHLSFSQFVKIKGKWVQKPTYLISKEYAYQVLDFDLETWTVRKINRQTKEPLESFEISNTDLEQKIISKQVKILIYD
jgi:hypothetical protein